MKRAIKNVSLLVVLSLSVGMFSGCGQVTNKSDVTSTQNSAANSAVSATSATSGNVTLPIVTKPTTFNIWHPIDVGVTKNMSSLAESEYYRELEKRTGVHIDFIHPAIGQEKESLNLLLASGEYPDFIQVDSRYPYPGGLDKGIADGTIVRLNELIEKCAPNYKATINLAPDIKKGSMTDTGNIAAFLAITTGYVQPSWIGPVVRQDWLDDLGLKTPETYNDWYIMLKAFKEKKGATSPLMLYSTGFQPNDCFASGYGVGESFYQVDGKVKFGPIEKGYQEYISMISKWYDEGLIDKDFATKKDYIPTGTFTTTGKSGAWWDMFVFISVNKTLSKDTKFREVAVPTPVKTAGDKLHLRQTNTRVGNTYWLLTSNCKDTETAVKWMDYTFSPDGEILANYGIEGKTYIKDADGKPMFTEFMYNNPDGLSFLETMRKYVKMPCSGGMPLHWERELAGQPEDNLNAMDIWTKNNDSSYFLPQTIFTTEEGTEYAQIMGDINTYVNEMNLKFIMGHDPLSKFEEFVSKIKSMNIDRAIQLQQAALDRYNARK